MFRGLKSLTVISECEPARRMLPRIVEMMHCNLGLEKIVFDCKFTGSAFGIRSITMMISDESQPERPLFVWPNLRHLVLRSFKLPLWQSAANVDRIALFLAAHFNIETLVINATHDGDINWEATRPFSLSSHPGSLPRLKMLRGFSRLVAGVLESSSACSSVVSVIQDWDTFGYSQVKESCLDRIVPALEQASSSQIRRLRLNEVEFSRAVYAKLAHVVPHVQFLELFGFVKDDDGTKESNFDPLVSLGNCLCFSSESNA